MAQDLSTPDPSLSPTHLSIRRGRATTTHYTHHQISMMVSRNTTLIPLLWLRIGPACEAGLSASIIIIIIITDLYSAFRSEDTEAFGAAQED